MHYYVKEYKREAIYRNEVLTGKLYQAAGIETADTWYGDEGGTPRIFSRIIDGLKKDGDALRAGTVANVNDAFVVDAWLANWDVIGQGYDNLKVINGRGVRIDTGAGLLYRAQGQPKGGNFGNTVTEIESLRDAGTNPQAAAVFKHVTQEDLIAGARKVLAVDRKTIEQLVDAYGPGDAAARQQLTATLLARQADIAAGKLAVFAGGAAGVKDNTGRQVIAPGEVLGDAQVQAMDWAVDGVVGAFKP